MEQSVWYYYMGATSESSCLIAGLLLETADVTTFTMEILYCGASPYIMMVT